MPAAPVAFTRPDFSRIYGDKGYKTGKVATARCYRRVVRNEEYRVERGGAREKNWCVRTQARLRQDARTQHFHK